MQVYELINDLRRFPQTAKVVLCDKQILIDCAPWRLSGEKVYDALCPDSDLPDNLRAALQKD